MKLSSRERFLIGVLFTIIIWVAALEVFIWPGRAGYQKSVELLESQKKEREEMEFYLSHYEDLEQKLKEWESLGNTEDFFYQDIDDTFMDRSLQAMAARAGVSISRMSIGGAELADYLYYSGTGAPGTGAPGTGAPGTGAPGTNGPEADGPEADAPQDSGKKAPGNGTARGRVKESVITMEIECPDAEGVMAFSDEIYREQKSVLVSFMDVEAVYESGEDGQETYQGMEGMVEVRYYYEETQ